MIFFQSKSSQNIKIPKIEPKGSRRLAVQPPPPGSSSKTQKLGEIALCRLTVGSLLPSGSFSRTQNR